MNEPLGIAFKIIDVFDRLGIAYWIGGSMASALYGTVRSTLEVGFVADIRFEHVQPLVERLRPEFVIDADMISGAIQHRSSFQLIHAQSMHRLEVYILKNRAFEQSQLKRRVLHTLATEPERQAYLCTGEDHLLSLLDLYRAAGEVSKPFWSDILGVLKVQSGRLDLAYLEQWAEQLGVNDLLSRAFIEST